MKTVSLHRNRSHFWVYHDGEAIPTEASLSIFKLFIIIKATFKYTRCETDTIPNIYIYLFTYHSTHPHLLGASFHCFWPSCTQHLVACLKVSRMVWNLSCCFSSSCHLPWKKCSPFGIQIVHREINVTLSLLESLKMLQMIFNFTFEELCWDLPHWLSRK